MTGNTPLVEYLNKSSTMHVVERKHFFKIFYANTSELLEILEELFTHC